ncbi:unnamed protein product [Rhodiola kirilowii]
MGLNKTPSLGMKLANLSTTGFDSFLPIIDKTAGDPAELTDIDIDISEVYFLIMHFLTTGPCQRTVRELWNELLEHQLLPRRYHAWYSRSGLRVLGDDANSASFPLSYDHLVHRYPHIDKDHLIKLLKQLLLKASSALNFKVVGGNALTAADVPTLLGTGSFSLLNGAKDKKTNQFKCPPSYLRWPHMGASQLHGLMLREIGGGFTRHHRAPSIRSACYAIAKPMTMMHKMDTTKKLRGHHSAVYCAIFDRSGRYVITGSDDRLVKIWSMETAFCLASCRGHEGDITDLTVSFNNVLVASASNDYSIRVWRMPDGYPISVLRGHTSAVTAIAFSPKPGSAYHLLSTSDDGTCRIWDARCSETSLRTYLPKPYHAVDVSSLGRNTNILSAGPSSSHQQGHRILCCAYNANGSVFVTGSSDNYARVWSACRTSTDNPEVLAHELDTLSGHEDDVNYVQFSGCIMATKSTTFEMMKEESTLKLKTSRFCHDNIVTCSRDGSAIIWVPAKFQRFHGKSGRWIRAYHLKVPPPPMPPQPPRGGPRQRLLPTPRGVNMIAWSLDNRFVLAAIMDCRICVWNAADGSLVHSLTGHTQSTYVLDVHPFNPRMAMSAGYDGKTIVWDIWEGIPVRVYNIGQIKLVDGKFSPDGTTIVLSDDVGQIYLVSTGEGESQKDAKYDQFFLGDYRPLGRDTHGNIIDQESQLVPYHRNIQDPLCDSSMVPYPEPYQTMYQKRRLGALNLEWRPSLIKFSIGPDSNLGQFYEIPPMLDLERTNEQLPDFTDFMLWEPDNEVFSDSTDPEYNVADEFCIDGDQGDLNAATSSESESGAGDDTNVKREQDGPSRLRRKNHHATGEPWAPSRRCVKRRTLGESSTCSGSNKGKKIKKGSKGVKKKASGSNSSRPQRKAAQSALNAYSRAVSISTDEDDADSLETCSSDSGLLILERNGYDGPLQNERFQLSERKEQPISIEPVESLDSQPCAKPKMKFVLKFSGKNSKSSDRAKNVGMHCGISTHVGSAEHQVSDEENGIHIKSGGKGSLGETKVLNDGEYAQMVVVRKEVNTTPCDWNIDDHQGEHQVRESTCSGPENHMLYNLSDRTMSGSGLPNMDLTGKAAYSQSDGTDKSSRVDPAARGKLKLKLKRSPLEPNNPSKLKIKFIKSAEDQIYDSGLADDDPSASGSDILHTRASALSCRNSKYDSQRELLEVAITADAQPRNRSMAIQKTNQEENILTDRSKDSGHCEAERKARHTVYSQIQVKGKAVVEECPSTTKSFPVSVSTGNNIESAPFCRMNSNYSMAEPSWLTLSEHDIGCRYVPQLGDEVIYFVQGHEEYIETGVAAPESPWKSIKRNFRAVETCKVSNLAYDTQSGSGDGCCKIRLKLLDPSSICFGKEFELTLPDLINFPEFIVEKTWFEAAIRRKWTNGDKCFVWWRDDNNKQDGGSWWEGSIISSEAKDPRFPDSPWERYTVQYKPDPNNPQSADISKHSHWELQDLEIPWEHCHLDLNTRNRLISAVSKAELMDECGIHKFNQAAQKLDYRNRFPAPLYPELIKLRLKNNYYRRLEAVKHDVDVMMSNAQSYFGRSGEQPAKMKRLAEMFSKAFSKL